MKRLAIVLGMMIFFSGCLRLSANAGYWRQGADEDEPSGKQIGFDTQHLISSSRNSKKNS